jgi:hypothetical protein
VLVERSLFAITKIAIVADLNQEQRLQIPVLPRAAVMLSVLAGLVGGCAGPASTDKGPLYRCEYGIEFTARFADDSVVVEGTRGYDVLTRAAGSTTRTYRNPRMSAEFGLGATGREAILRYPLLPLVARCVRD